MCHSNRPIAYYSTEQKQSIQVPVIDNKELLHKYHAENYQHKVNWIWTWTQRYKGVKTKYL